MVKMNIVSMYGNAFDIGDSIFLSSVGQREICNEALSFYNKYLGFGISYYVEPCAIEFQNDNYDERYWNEDKINELEKELYDLQKEIDITNYNEISIDLDASVNVIIDYMDDYCKYLMDNNSDLVSDEMARYIIDNMKKEKERLEKFLAKYE